MKTNPFSQNWSEVTSGNRNEIVFERLNKTYGAYQIRTDYDNTLLKAFSATVFFIALFSSLTFIHENISIPKRPPTIPDSAIFVKPPTRIIIDPPPTETHFQKQNNTNTIPIVQNDSVEPVDTTLLASVNTGSNNGGDNDPNSDPNPNTGGGGGGGGGGNPEPVDSVMTFPEIMPIFPGGDDGLFHYLHSNTHIPQDVVETGYVKEKVCVAFVINKEGAVTEASLMKGGCKIFQLNNEALRVVNKMPKWEPGKQNGNPVRVRMVLPIRFEVK